MCSAATPGWFPTTRRSAERAIDDYRPTNDELVDRSKGKIRADVVFDRLVALGSAASERTCRRAVADAKRRWSAGRGRVYRPWIAEPGAWLQFDWGVGPTVVGRATVLVFA